MANHSCLTNTGDLKFWFDQLDATGWSLYRGHVGGSNGRMPLSNMIYKNDGQSMGQTESWELLQRLINMQSVNGGMFTIYVPGKSQNKGSYSWLKINGPAMAMGQAGIGGMPGYALGYVPADEVNRRINDALEKERLKRDIEDLKAEQDAKMSIVEMTVDKVLNELDINRTIEQVGAIISGFIQSKKVPVSLQGPPGEPITQTADQVTSQGGYEYDERAIAFLDQVRPNFGSDEEFYGFLDVLAAKFLSNPAMYIALIQNS